jgi:hypothetical protein
MDVIILFIINKKTKVDSRLLMHKRGLKNNQFENILNF